MWTFSEDGGTVFVDFPSASQPSCDAMIPGSDAIAVGRTTVSLSGAAECRGTWGDEPIVVYPGEGVASEALCNIVQPRVAYTIKSTQTSGNTKKFTLRAGDYEVTMTGKELIRRPGFGGGNVIAYLSDSQGQELLFNEIVNDGKSYKFTTHQYELVGEAYHLKVTMPSGSWSVTFTPE